jgi:hypothetical protein
MDNRFVSANTYKRMIRMTNRPIVLIFLIAFSATDGSASEVKVSPEYLAGKWVLGEKQACGSTQTTYIIIRGNGTLEIGRDATARAVGFWELDDDALTVHMLVSPGSTEARNPFYRENYGYQYLTAKVLEAQENTFKVISSRNVEAGAQMLSRCP